MARKMKCVIKWQPIETAPKNKHLLLYGVYQGEYGGSLDENGMAHGLICDDDSFDCIRPMIGCAGRSFEPLYWIPIPIFPKLKNGGETSWDEKRRGGYQKADFL